MTSIILAVTLVTFLSIISCESHEWEKGHVHRNTRQDPESLPEWDQQGYVFFCLCMGRFGNQADHFLGGMAFAKALNRTLVLPPFRTYRNVRFTEWFKMEPIQSYHRAILAEDFMAYLAPDHWPPSERIGFCWKPHNDKDKDCKMKEGNPFGDFWNALGVNFEKSIVYQISYYESEMNKWKEQYPPSKYPVLTFRGAPAHYPVFSHHRKLQKYMVFSDKVKNEAKMYLETHFPGKTYVGIHLRNGPDWLNACQGTENLPFYMASPQCLEGTKRKVTKIMCYPDQSEVIRLVKKIVIKTNAEVVFIATDRYPMIDAIESSLKEYNVKAYHADPHLPLLDLDILINSDYFIGNCVSSFTAFVKRARDTQGRPTAFFGFS